MRKSKTKWIRVFDSEDQHVRTDSIGTDRRERKSLGPSNDKSAAVKIEMRAAELELACAGASEAETRGYRAHMMVDDVPDGGEAGWLEREISCAGDSAEGLDYPHAWVWDVTRPVAVQYPYAIAQSEATTQFNALCDGHLADVEALIVNVAPAPPPPGWQAKVHAACDAIDEQTSHADLDGIDQSEPTPPTDAPLVDTDDEATHVGSIDERFNDGDEP